MLDYDVLASLGAPLDILSAYSVEVVRRPGSKVWHRRPSGAVGCSRARALVELDHSERSSASPISLHQSGASLCSADACRWPSAARALIEAASDASELLERFDLAQRCGDDIAAHITLERLSRLVDQLRCGRRVGARHAGRDFERHRLLAYWLEQATQQRGAKYRAGEAIAGAEDAKRWSRHALRAAAAREVGLDQAAVRSSGLSWPLASLAHRHFVEAAGAGLPDDAVRDKVEKAVLAVSEDLGEDLEAVRGGLGQMLRVWGVAIDEIASEDAEPRVVVLSILPLSDSPRDSASFLVGLGGRSWPSYTGGGGTTLTLVPRLVAARVVEERHMVAPHQPDGELTILGCCAKEAFDALAEVFVTLYATREQSAGRIWELTLAACEVATGSTSPYRTMPSQGF